MPSRLSDPSRLSVTYKLVLFQQTSSVHRDQLAADRNALGLGPKRPTLGFVQIRLPYDRFVSPVDTGRPSTCGF